MSLWQAMQKPQKLLWTINLALITLVVVMVVSFFLPSSQEDEDISPVSVVKRPATQPKPVEKAKPINHSLILERNMFNSRSDQGPKVVPKVPPKAPVAAQPVTKPKPKPTPLRLRLVGTVAGNQQTSLAIIEDLSQKGQDLYGVGDTLQGATIKSIEQNRVFLARQDQNYTLELSVTQSGSSPKPTPAPKAVAQASHAAPQVYDPNPPKVAKRDTNRPNLTPPKPNQARLRLEPHYVDGQEQGLKIAGLKESLGTKLVGIKNGDVVQAVNGLSTPNQRKAIQVMRKARKLGKARVKLVRGNKTKTVSF